MARVKISEYRAKKLFDKAYLGISIKNASDPRLDSLDPEKRYVVKIDQGIKKRFKKGLVMLDKTPFEVKKSITEWREKGYQQFLIEPFVVHNVSDEKYLAIERVRAGYLLYYANQGGVDIEENADNVKKSVIKDRSELVEIAKELGCDWEMLLQLIDTFDANYFSFLEINPLVILDGDMFFLDMAGETDSTGEFFVNGAWSKDDIVLGSQMEQTIQEEQVQLLSEKSQAAFSLTVLNKNASIFVLLSGGGASVTLADEIYNQGFGKELANYGEYSGNPTEEETYLYTQNILQLLLTSKAPKKILLIGGGVANFTDIRITFRGILKALSEVSNKLKELEVKVFVRRGGPNQEEGLALMKQFLNKNNLLGEISGPKMQLDEIVKKAIKAL